MDVNLATSGVTQRGGGLVCQWPGKGAAQDALQDEVAQQVVQVHREVQELAGGAGLAFRHTICVVLHTCLQSVK